jgi:hypothetical protein
VVDLDSVAIKDSLVPHVFSVVLRCGQEAAMGDVSCADRRVVGDDAWYRIGGDTEAVVSCQRKRGKRGKGEGRK